MRLQQRPQQAAVELDGPSEESQVDLFYQLSLWDRLPPVMRPTWDRASLGWQLPSVEGDAWGDSAVGCEAPAVPAVGG